MNPSHPKKREKYTMPSMTRLDHLLVILSEESSEVVKCACKSLRFGLTDIEPDHHENNAARLIREIADFTAVVEMLGDELESQSNVGLDADTLIKEKKAKVERFISYSRELGKVE